MKNIIAIGAHFDDVDIGVGGTLAKLAAEKKNVYKITLTNNVTFSKKLSLNISYRSSLIGSNKSSKILGTKEIKNPKVQECSNLKYKKEIMQYIENIIYNKKIDTAFIHYDHDLNQDHIAASEISKTATRHCKNVFMFQSNFYLSSKNFSPNFFVNITKYIEVKKKALKCYQRQHDRFGKLFEMNIERNKIYGFQSNCKYAEAFVSLKYLYE